MLRIDRVLGHELIVDEPERFNSLIDLREYQLIFCDGKENESR
jgi:hypothetical protein